MEIAVDCLGCPWDCRGAPPKDNVHPSPKHMLLLARRTTSIRSSQRLARTQNNLSIVAYDTGRPGIIFGDTGKQVSEVKKQRGTRASTSNFRAVPGRTATTDKTLKAAVIGGSNVDS